MSDLISVFHVDWKLLLAQIVNFAVVFWLVSYIVWRPLKKMMQKRAETIQSGIDASIQSETLLLQAKNQAKNIEFLAEKSASEVRSKSEQEYQEKIERAKQDAVINANLIIESAKDKSDQEHKNMLKVFRGESIDIIINTTRKLLQTELDNPEQKKAFVDKLLMQSK
jgi:F-type H+-transporting ATPase subunit b